MHSCAVRHSKAKAQFNSKESVVTAAEDVLISPRLVHNVRIEGPFGDDKEWIVEKIVIGTDTSNILAAPMTWINTDHLYLPIANPSPRPWYIRTGDVIGYLQKPASFDNPTGEALEKYVASAESLKAMIGSTLREQDLATALMACPPHNDQLDGDDQWGPKTTAVPEDPLFGDVSNLVNLGPDIPSKVLPRLKEVLRKNTKAFGIDGRLGQVSTCVEVPLKSGTTPISVPMYSASPAKCEVINKQVQAWFKASVIEPSSSPWGFPVVVVYRNGKPHLVIDYRKLNAQTIPDEFPIP